MENSNSQDMFGPVYSEPWPKVLCLMFVKFAESEMLGQVKQPNGQLKVRGSVRSRTEIVLTTAESTRKCQVQD